MAKLRRISKTAAVQSRLGFETLEARLPLSCDGVAPVEPVSIDRAVDVVNCFGADLYEQMQKVPGNLLISPLSIASALSMVQMGAVGETATQFENLLGSGSQPGVHDSFRLLLQSLLTPSDNYSLAIGNAFWPESGRKPQPGYVDGIRDNYQGQVEALDYSNPEQAANRINAWVSEQTRGLIPDLVQPEDVQGLIAALTNALYFKALWRSPFPETSQPVFRPFTRGDGVAVDVPFMFTQVYGRQGRLAGVDVLELPFRQQESSMVLMMPNAGNATNDLPATTFDAVNTWLSTETEIECHSVDLPKFGFTAANSLLPVLEGMGMPVAGDFSQMFERDNDILIKDVLHKAKIAVTEQGTEAAAATGVKFIVCFAEGTPIRTPHGEKPIEELEAGDLVLSRDENRLQGPVQAKKIEEVFERCGYVLSLRVNGHTIRATSEHPFYVKDAGWTTATKLSVGDLLASEAGEWLTVEQIDTSQQEERVFNFRVADHHTYFVGAQSWGFAVWTHNCCSRDEPFNRPFHFFIRDNKTSAILFMGRVDDPLQVENEVNPQFIPASFPGDTDLNGVVDFVDFVRLAENFGHDQAEWQDGDFDGDGRVDFSDFVILANNFGKSRLPQAALPVTSTATASAPYRNAASALAADDFFEQLESDASRSSL